MVQWWKSLFTVEATTSSSNEIYISFAIAQWILCAQGFYQVAEVECSTLVYNYTPVPCTMKVAITFIVHLCRTPLSYTFVVVYNTVPQQTCLIKLYDKRWTIHMYNKGVQLHSNVQHSTSDSSHNGVFDHRHLEYKYGTVPAIKVQSLHIMASTIPERVHCFLLWGDK